MLARLLRTFALIASLVVAVSFGLFAIDEAASASARTQIEIDGRAAGPIVDPSPLEEQAREAAHSDLREAIDDADDVLLAPFASVANDAGSRWVRRGTPALIALLIYGFGLGFVARSLTAR